jgi:hypothetical protein
VFGRLLTAVIELAFIAILIAMLIMAVVFAFDAMHAI